MSTLPIAIIRECDGEAHKNPFIDNCWTCAPNWGWTLHCASCGAQLMYNCRAKLNRVCPRCGITHARIDYKKLHDSQRISA